MASKHPVELTAYEAKQVAEVKAYVDGHLNERLTAEDMALQWGISLYKLRVGFVRLYHQSFADYLKAKRMERAKELLSTGNKINFEIALDCGYRDESAFVRAFRKWFGQTPDAFRKRRF